MGDTGYVQTGARVVEASGLAPACGAGQAAIDGDLNTEVCLNPGYIVLDFNPAGTSGMDELWIKMHGACGTLAHGYGPLVFSLYNWNTNQFQEVQRYNYAVPEIWHWMEFKVADNLADLVKPDGTIRLKIFSPEHIGTSARVCEVYARAIQGESIRIESMPVRVIDGIGARYAQQLTAAEINSVQDLYMIYPVTLASQVRLSIVRLYEFQSKAGIAINTRFDRDTYGALFEMTLVDIVQTPDADLQETTGLSQAEISELKYEIATLFVALDNAVVKDLTLGSFET